MNQFEFDSRPGRPAGIGIIVIAILMVGFMSHHPVTSGDSFAQSLGTIVDQRGLSAVVHGVLMVLMALLWTILVNVFGAARLSGSTTAGTVAQSIGTLAMIGAALISGFLVSDLAAYLTERPDQHETGRLMLVTAHMINQRLAHLGVVAMATAMIFWSIGLVSQASLWRWVGIFGLVAGIGIALAMLLGAIHLDVHGMLATLVVLVMWYVGIGVALIRDASMNREPVD